MVNISGVGSIGLGWHHSPRLLWCESSRLTVERDRRTVKLARQPRCRDEEQAGQARLLSSLTVHSHHLLARRLLSFAHSPRPEQHLDFNQNKPDN